MAVKNSGHARKRWRVTFKLPILHHQHSQRPIDLDVNEYSFEVLGHDTGVAATRAFKLLRKQPELKGAIIRDCFITVKFLEYFTKQDEANLVQAEKETEAHPDESQGLFEQTFIGRYHPRDKSEKPE